MAKSQNIAVDIGNSSIKSLRFEGEVAQEPKAWKSLFELKAHYEGVDCQWIFSSVGNNRAEIEDLFTKSDYLILDKKTSIPLKINYKTPETLGMDRLAAAVGANDQFPSHNIIVIDMGSCITYDFVDRSGVFQGGIIAPGLKMRMKAMAQQTKQLPDISSEWETIERNNPGKSTKECMLNGSFSAICHEMNGIINEYKEEFDDLCVVLTGGDYPHFESNIKEPIFADPNLVLMGLNRILKYNQ